MSTPLNPETRDKLLLEYSGGSYEQRQVSTPSHPVPLHPATRDHLYASLLLADSDARDLSGTTEFRVDDLLVARLSDEGPATIPGPGDPSGRHAVEVPYEAPEEK